jgi:uncharacterized protein
MSSLADLPATPGRPPRHQRPLAGARGWLVTDGKQGMDVQVRGVADALGLDYSFKQVSPHGLYRLLAPWGPVSPVERFGKPGSPFAPPFPDIALATGRLSIPYMRALARHAGLRTFRVVLQDPKTSPRIADLIWVPTHDKRRGANVVTTLTHRSALRGSGARSRLSSPSCHILVSPSSSAARAEPTILVARRSRDWPV